MTCPYSKAELRARLTPLQYQVTQEKGTERAFTGKFYRCKQAGVYSCVVCGQELFSSASKYDSGCGWPSFNAVLNNGKVTLKKDVSHGMVRTEVSCSVCGAHLGHVFDDGPKPQGKRFCINSASLDFRNIDDSEFEQRTDKEVKMEVESQDTNGCMYGKCSLQSTPMETTNGVTDQENSKEVTQTDNSVSNGTGGRHQTRAEFFMQNGNGHEDSSTINGKSLKNRTWRSYSKDHTNGNYSEQDTPVKYYQRWSFSTNSSSPSSSASSSPNHSFKRSGQSTPKRSNSTSPSRIGEDASTPCSRPGRVFGSSLKSREPVSHVKRLTSRFEQVAKNCQNGEDVPTRPPRAKHSHSPSPHNTMANGR